MNNKTVTQIVRPAGSAATRSIVCGVCGCRGQNIVTFSDGTSGYACRWNSHPTFTFPKVRDSLSY